VRLRLRVNAADSNYFLVTGKVYAGHVPERAKLRSRNSTRPLRRIEVLHQRNLITIRSPCLLAIVPEVKSFPKCV